MEREGQADLPRALQPRLLGRAAARRPSWEAGASRAPRERTAGRLRRLARARRPRTGTRHGPRHHRRRRGPPRVRLACRTAKPVKGFPVLVEDPDKVASVDPTHQRADVQRQRAGRRNRNRRRPGQDRRHARRSPTSTGRASRRRSSSAPTRSTSTGTGDEGAINAVGPDHDLARRARRDGPAEVRQRPRLRDQGERLLGRTVLLRDRRLQVRTRNARRGLPRRLAGEDRDHRRRPAAGRRRGHQRLAGRRAARPAPKAAKG